MQGKRGVLRQGQVQGLTMVQERKRQRSVAKARFITELGRLREALVDDILSAGFAPKRFEAPTKEPQVHFLKRIGPEVNLGNIAAGDLISVETLRPGLTSDLRTFRASAQ